MSSRKTRKTRKGKENKDEGKEKMSMVGGAPRPAQDVQKVLYTTGTDGVQKQTIFCTPKYSENDELTIFQAYLTRIGYVLSEPNSMVLIKDKLKNLGPLNSFPVTCTKKDVPTDKKTFIIYKNRDAFEQAKGMKDKDINAINAFYDKYTEIDVNKYKNVEKVIPTAAKESAKKVRESAANKTSSNDARRSRNYEDEYE
jgi:hypothetical protein